MILAAAFCVALLGSLGATPRVVRWAVARGYLDQPGGRRIHAQPVPRVGGVAVFVSTVLGLLAAMLLGHDRPAGAFQHDLLYAGLLACGGLLFLVGLRDDLKEIKPLPKLLVQLAAALIVALLGVRIEMLGFGAASLGLGLLALPITVLWIVGVTNAYNLIDGLDGLATGIAVVALATMLVIALLLGRADAALVCAALLGALLGFLPYNFNPARIFLGDAGSLFIGFLLAVLSISASTKGTPAVLVLAPLFILALPLMDISLAMLRRWLRRLPISAPDRRHIHHRLVDLGLTPRGAVLVLYGVSILMAGVAVLLVSMPPQAVTLVTAAGGALTLGLMLLGVYRLDYHEIATVGTVLVHGPMKLRKLLSDRVHAQDLARLVPHARTLDELNAILSDNVELFGFAHMEVCPVASEESRAAICSRSDGNPWKADYPVSPFDPKTSDWYVLRIWCILGRRYRPYGAERVSGILGPVIEQWMTEQGARVGTGRPHRLRAVESRALAAGM